MTWWIILIEALVFAVIFTVIIFTYFRGERKYSPTSIHSYPPDIQEEYFKTHEKIDVSYRSKSVLLTKSLGVLIFTGILFVCALIAGASTFWQGFLLALGLMAWIGIYDTCFLDWVYDCPSVDFVLCLVHADGEDRSGKQCREWPAYLQALLFLEVMNWYDGIVIDKVWVGYSRFWLLPGCEDIPYVQTWKQVLKKRGILTLIWVVGAAVVAGIVVLMF